MKKIIIIGFVLLIGLANAQFIKYGVTANFHQSSIVKVHDYSKGAFGGGIGIFADVSLVPNDIYDSAWLYFTPQLEFNTLGENANHPKEEKQKYHNNYIGLPLYIKYFLRSNGYKGDLYFMAGPRLEFLVSEKRSGPPADFEAQEQNISSFGYGVSVGAGIKINDKLDAFIRFDRGFSKIYPDYTRDATYNRMLALGINYYIGETN